MSPTVSAMRRSEPAYVHFAQPRIEASSATISSARSVATPSWTRPPADCMTSMPCRMFSTVLGPNPFTPSSMPEWMASASCSTLAIPRSWCRTMAFLGPRVGIEISSRTPAGICSRSFSMASTPPVRRYSRI